MHSFVAISFKFCVGKCYQESEKRDWILNRIQNVRFKAIITISVREKKKNKHHNVNTGPTLATSKETTQKAKWDKIKCACLCLSPLRKKRQQHKDRTTNPLNI
jgi:hypothetical protein